MTSIPTFPQHNPDTPPLRRLSPGEIAEAARTLFGEDVQKISAPGGKARDSLRVTLPSRSVIVTQRPTEHAFEMERAVLSHLSQAGAPVPKYLGSHGHLLFQQDAGRARLSVQLAKLPQDRVHQIALSAFQSLWQLKHIASETGLTAKLPIIAMSNDWLTPFCNMPAKLSRATGIALPALDIEELVKVLVPPPNRFVKWDARPGNAAVQPDGRVIWFDWEHVGRRAGAEDFGFLAGDEFWPLGADPTLELFARTSPHATAPSLRFLTCFTTLQITQRIDMILTRVQTKGWADADTALRYDKIGATPDMLQRLARHGAQWAAHDSRVAPLTDWFARIAEVVVKMQ